MYLNAVDINGVLIERPAADVVLGAQFVGLTHTGKRDQQALDRTTGCVRHDARCRRIDMIHRALRMLDTAHLDLTEQLLVRQQLDIDIDDLAQVDDTLLDRGISDHREVEYHRIRFVQEEFVIAVFVGCRTDRTVGVEYHHIS